MFKKWDFIIIIALLCLSFIPELIFGLSLDKSSTGNYASITLDGKPYKTIDLTNHRGEEQFPIETEHGYNIIAVRNSSIGIIEADCPDQLCIKAGFIEKPGELLVCLPHKLMIEIKTDASTAGLDVIPVH